MAIQFLLVNFAESRTVLADGSAVGVTNHILMLPADEYEISLDGGGYTPASQTIALDGTSMVRPLVIAFSAAPAAAVRGAPPSVPDAPRAPERKVRTKAKAGSPRTRKAPKAASPKAASPKVASPKVAAPKATAPKTTGRGKKHA